LNSCRLIFSEFMETLALEKSFEKLPRIFTEEEKSPIISAPKNSTTYERTLLFLEKTENYTEGCPLKDLVNF